jgi:hypothetical protein
MYLVERKNNKKRYAVKMHTNSQRFEFSNGEKLTNKKFHCLFRIVKELDKIEYDHYSKLYKVEDAINTSNTVYFLNPFTQCKVRFKNNIAPVGFIRLQP